MKIYHVPVTLKEVENNGSYELSYDIYIKSTSLKKALEKAKQSYKIEFGISKTDFIDIVGDFNVKGKAYVITYETGKVLVRTSDIDKLMSYIEDDAISVELYSEYCLIIK